MDIASSTEMVTGAITSFKNQAFIILGLLIVVALGLFFFRWAWGKFKHHAK